MQPCFVETKDGFCFLKDKNLCMWKNAVR